MNYIARAHRRIRGGVAQFRYYSDGITSFRKGVLDGEFVIEKWIDNNFDLPTLENMTQYYLYSDGIDTYRDGVRDGEFVIDKALTETGFNGLESTDGGATGDWLAISSQ